MKDLRTTYPSTRRKHTNTSHKFSHETNTCHNLTRMTHTRHHLSHMPNTGHHLSHTTHTHHTTDTRHHLSHMTNTRQHLSHTKASINASKAHIHSRKFRAKSLKAERLHTLSKIQTFKSERASNCRASLQERIPTAIADSPVFNSEQYKKHPDASSAQELLEQRTDLFPSQK